MAGDPPPNNLPEVPWHRKLNLRQNQRQRMSNSGRSFISPDFILTRLPNKDGMVPIFILRILQADEAPYHSQRSGTAGKTIETCGKLNDGKHLEERLRWFHPRIKSNRDPKLFMQETPFWHGGSNIRSNLAFPETPGRGDCNT